MCGIVCTFNIKQPVEVLRPQILQMSKIIRHRGPDWSGIFANEHAILAHERLSIVDPHSGKQPLYSKDGKRVLAVNGEIYNHKELEKAGIKHVYYESPGTAHEWLSWRRSLNQFASLIFK